MYLPVLVSSFVVAVAALGPRAPHEEKAMAINVRATNKQRPAESPRPGAATSHGCFSAQGEWEDPKGYQVHEPSMGFCIDLLCNKDGGNYTVVATRGDQCFCGYKYPPKGSLADDKKCDYKCPSYGEESCGSITGKFWSVYNTGIQVAVPYLDDPEEETTSAADTAPSSTAPPQEEEKDDDSNKGTNVGGIVAGVVVAVVAIAGSIAGVFFYLRRKRNKEIEEEHRRNAAVNSFIGHKPASSDAMSISDTRLDPVMAHRRLSDGSIADNQDYSRRILKVTNV